MHAQMETPSPAAGREGAEGSPAARLTGSGRAILPSPDAVVKPAAWSGTDEQRRALIRFGHCTCHRTSPCPVCLAWDATLRQIEARGGIV